MPAPPPPPQPPPSKKERFARFISRIKNRANRSSSGSSLVVQTGFPTSLADLVVKNRAKFRKRKQKPPRSSDRDSTASAAVRSESDGSDHPTITAVAIPRPIDGVADRGKRKGIGIGLGFLTLVLLTVGREWVVAGITVLTFGVLALELLGVLKPRANQRNSSEILIEGFDLRGRELVSPIREIEVQNHHNSLQLERSEEILIERRDLDPVGNSNKDQDLGNPRKSNRKHIFRKLFRKKNEESSSFLDDSITSHEEVLIEEDKGGDGEELSENHEEKFISFEASNEISEIHTEDVNVVKDDGVDIRLRRWRILVFIIVVLLGLLGGKGVALVLTVVWYLFFGCTGSVWTKWKKRQID